LTQPNSIFAKVNISPIRRKLSIPHFGAQSPRQPIIQQRMSGQALQVDAEFESARVRRALYREGRKGGLAPWPERRAKEMIEAGPQEALTLKEWAEACGLSVAHFASAFRRTVGDAPHRWKTRQRTERAKVPLAGGVRWPKSPVQCGFNDQSRFTRVFALVCGQPPGAWRRDRHSADYKSKEARICRSHDCRTRRHRNRRRPFADPSAIADGASIAHPDEGRARSS
jgi:AraC-like DNA-binding protein